MAGEQLVPPPLWWLHRNPRRSPPPFLAGFKEGPPIFLGGPRPDLGPPVVPSYLSFGEEFPHQNEQQKKTGWYQLLLTSLEDLVTNIHSAFPARCIPLPGPGLPGARRGARVRCSTSQGPTLREKHTETRTIVKQIDGSL